MSTTGEQVQVTPELLDAICEAAQWLIDGRPHVFAMFREVATAPRVLALVQRIRELESEVRVLEEHLEFR